MSRSLRIFLFLAALPVFAADAYRVVDLTRNPAATNLRFAGVTADAAFVIADRALWGSDGTESGTVRLRGSLSDSEMLPENFTADAHALYFGAFDDLGVRRLWATDGTVAGTRMLPTGSEAVARVLDAVDGEVWFTTASGGDFVVWRTTEARGPVRVASIAGSIADVVRADAKLYIATTQGLWALVPSGVTRLTTAPSQAPVVAGGQVYFIGSTAESGEELWISDGTQAGTHLLRDERVGPDSWFVQPGVLRAFGDRVLYTSAGVLRSTDVQGRTRVLRLGFTGTLPPIAVINGRALVTFHGAGTASSRLWRTDGTPEGTQVVRPESPRASGPVIASGAYGYYFDARPGGPPELFRTDGTEDGTRPVQNVRPLDERGIGTSSSLIAAGDKIFFAAHRNEQDPFELWVTDGTDAGTRAIHSLLRDPAAWNDVSSYPDRLVATSNRLFFVAGSDFGAGTWSTDGSARGTRQISSGRMSPVAAVGDTLILNELLPNAGLFAWNDATGAVRLGTTTHTSSISEFRQPLFASGRAFLLDGGLVATDGTPAGTVEIQQYQRFAAVLAKQLWFTTTDRLYRTDGTKAGTRQIARLPDNTSRTDAFRASLLFWANRQLFRFAPGDQGPVSVAAIDSVDASAAINGALLFTRRGTSGPAELWRTDGTSAGTNRIMALGSQRQVSGMFSLGDRVLVLFGYGEHVELWVTDGTSSGTRLLLFDGVNSSPRVIDGIAWFARSDAEHGSELWRSDGTVEGTRLAADIAPGSDSSNPNRMVRMGGALYFSAFTKDAGEELWAYPLARNPVVLVGDVRVSEAEFRVTFPVRLSEAATERVTVDYETADDTAKAGVDYQSARGTLTFEPGEIAKSVTVRVIGDSRNSDRSFLLRATRADVRIVRGEGVAVIEDDDKLADLSLVPHLGFSSLRFTVSNAGPSTATGAHLTMSSEPPFWFGDFHAIPSGGSLDQSAQVGITFDLAAHVDAVERDPVPANNEVRIRGTLDMAVASPVVREGETGTILVTDERGGAYRLTSSDPEVVSLPEFRVLRTSDRSDETTFTARKPGIVTITAILPDSSPSVTVRVLPAKAPLRAEPVVSFDRASLCFGCRNVLHVQLSEVAIHPRLASGSVTVFLDGVQLAPSVLDADARAHVPLPQLLPGPHGIRIVYSGDERFLDVESTTQIDIAKRTPPVRVVRNGSDVRITLDGAPGHPPTGTITFAGHPIAIASSNLSDAEAVLTGIPAYTLVVSFSYSGDASYNGGSLRLPIEENRSRAVH